MRNEKGNEEMKEFGNKIQLLVAGFRKCNFVWHFSCIARVALFHYQQPAGPGLRTSKHYHIIVLSY
jgi:hypothetical protein